MWEVRAFTGRDERGRPTQISRTVRGTKKDALRVAAELTVRPVTQAASATVAELLTHWVEQNEATWAAATRRDNRGRAAAILADSLAKIPISRVTVADIERWHARTRQVGVGEMAVKNRHTVLRAAFRQAVRWGWLDTNPAATARLSHAKRLPRASMSAVGAWWRRARKAAGIDPAWRLHDLRHWSATVAITSGHDVRTVAGRLGHANPAMTLRVHAHALQAADEAVAKTLGRILDPSEG